MVINVRKFFNSINKELDTEKKCVYGSNINIYYLLLYQLMVSRSICKHFRL